MRNFNEFNTSIIKKLSEFETLKELKLSYNQTRFIKIQKPLED